MIKRSLEKSIIELSKHFPVIMLTGPRQVGKTTLLENISKNREYITLDDLEQRRLAKQDPALFLQIHKPPLFIDEIQYAPELFSYIKMYVDKNNVWHVLMFCSMVADIMILVNSEGFNYARYTSIICNGGEQVEKRFTIKERY